MRSIVKILYGSHMYGTASEESDTDYKGVFLPSLEDCILNRVPRSISKSSGNGAKNTSSDVDEEYYSLQYFLKLACNGEMIVLDMLHAPKSNILETSELWELLQENRAKFYTKSLSGYLGYIRSQTAKYSIKGERLEAIAEVIKLLDEYGDNEKLEVLWGRLPKSEFCKVVDNPREPRRKHYDCCGKMFQDTMRVGYSKNILQSAYDRYGARARMAQENKGVDWKAVSHAFRAAYQLKEIYETGDLKYPLANARYIKEMKYGKHHYQLEGLGEKLDSLLREVEDLAQKSNYPEKADISWFESLIVSETLKKQ